MQGGRTGKGIGRSVVVASMPVVRFGGKGKRKGELGVKRGGGECGAISGRGGDAGVVCVHTRGGAGGCPRKKKMGGAHAVVGGEGGGERGQPEAKA
jgi:hypothetical protein